MSNATLARQPGPGRLLVHDGEEKNATSPGSCGVFDIRGKDEHVSGTERVLVAGSGECYFSFDDLDRDRPVSPVSWQISTRRDAQDREPERAFLDESACAAPVSGDEIAVNDPLIPGQVVDQHVALQSTVHR